jgi:uroporphyrin-III C-methyltransferase
VGRAGPEPGTVYLVGAGPGDPGLLTVRAAEILAAADSVFHDQLVPADVIGLARPGALLIDVGHRAGSAHRDPAGVAAQMAVRAREGEVVCRLKGGDSFVFGRGGEDLEALAAEGVPVAVVPGVSSAVAGPAAAGISVTHRGIARSFVVVTGHDDLDWSRLRADTVVVLMSLRRLTEIAAAMVDAGWAEQTPAAVVSQATTPRQHQVFATLGSIAGRVRKEAVPPPALLVVGEVVAMAAER